MSQIKKQKEKSKKSGFSRNTVIAIGVVIVVCIVAVCGIVLLNLGPLQPQTGAATPIVVTPTGTAAPGATNVTTEPSPVSTQSNQISSFNTAGALYDQSLDLANVGDYTAALAAADKALALNVTALIPLIQANRAGILVAMGEYDQAITAADAALAVQGNLTTVHSIAWYNKANALSAQGKTTEAEAAYANASALDPKLKHP
ncbi:MAG: tetratricopeptide repeat protein [Methanoregula sp.]|jgi:tetratricopeptide (TPR) repeat protein